MQRFVLTQKNLGYSFSTCYYALSYHLFRIAVLTIKAYLEEHPPSNDDPKIFHVWRKYLSSPDSFFVKFIRAPKETGDFCHLPGESYDVDESTFITDTMRDFLMHMFPRLPHDENESLGVIRASSHDGEYMEITEVEIDSVALGFTFIASYGLRRLADDTYFRIAPVEVAKDEWLREILPRMDQFMQGLRDDPTFASTDSEGRELLLDYFLNLWD